MDYKIVDGKSIRFEVIGRVIPKQSFKMGKGHGYTPNEVKAYGREVSFEAEQAVLGVGMLEGQIECQVDVYFEIPKDTAKWKRPLMMAQIMNPIVRPDFDNLVKNICDACNDIVFVDDSQIISGFISKYYSDIPKVIATFTERVIIDPDGNVVEMKLKRKKKSKGR